MKPSSEIKVNCLGRGGNKVYKIFIISKQKNAEQSWL